MKFISYITIFLFLFICFSKQDEIILANIIYPYLLTLINKNIIMLASDGIHFYDSTLKSEDSSKKITFDEDSQILKKEDFSKTAMVQFPAEHGGYIMILVIDTIYFFDSEGMHIDSKNLSEYINSEYYYLIPYKKENNNLHYIISFKNAEKNYTLTHFTFNIDSHLNENVMIKRLKVTVQINNNNNIGNAAGLSCLFMSHPSYDHDILVCFYATYYPTEIHSRSFDPNNGFEELTEYFKYYSEDYSTPFPNYVKAVTNPNKQKALILLNSQCLYTMTFDFNNFFSEFKNENVDKYCNLDASFYRNKIIYFTESHEYIFISSLYGSPRVPIIIFNEDFTLKQKGYFQAGQNIYAIYAMSSFWNGENYTLIFDNGNSPENAFLTIANLTTLEPGDNVETPTTTIQTTLPTSQTTQPSITKNEKCKRETSESSDYDLCIECNTDKGYFSAEFSDNSFLHGFTECFNSDSKPINFYYDNSEQKYKQCYKTCKSCNIGGNKNINNCLECDNNYIKVPELTDTTNCVISCSYMYYYNSYGEYKCTNENICPEEASIYIQELNKCTDDCSKENKFKYKYGGKCLESCPQNTSPNLNNICMENNNYCSKTENKIEIIEKLNFNEIDLNAKNYAEEFSYTIKHVSHFYNDFYSILLYKDLNCIEELSFNSPKVDFYSCFKKVSEKLNPPTTDNIIVLLIEKLNPQKKSTTIYSFYHPITGEKLDIGNICSEEQVIVKQSVISQLNNSNVNLDDILFLTQQNIDIFNKSHDFYTDICFDFESPNGKDITLKDRMLTYYPNITLCDDGCLSNGVNLTSLESICECKFNNLINPDLLENEVMGEALGGIVDLISSSNIFVLKCFKEVFIKKNILKNVGGYIIVGITAVKIIFTIIFFAKDMTNIFRYIFNLTENFIKYIKNKKKKNKINGGNFHDKENAPPKKSNKKLNHKINRPKSFKILPYNYEYIKNTSNTQKSEESMRKSSRKNLKSNESAKRDSYNDNDIHVFNFEKAINDISPKINNTNGSLNDDINIKEYLKTDLDDMEYDDAIKYDDRKFCEFYWDRLKDKQIIINTFCNYEKLKPFSIKILIFLLYIDLYFVINGLFYSEEYISNLFHSTEKETFFSFFERSIERFFYATIVSVIVETIIGFIFIEEKRIKRIFKREKDNFMQLKYEIFQVIKNMRKRFIFFTILCFLIVLISWYYVNCFNNVYYGVCIEWVKSSIVIIIITQILSIISAFIEAILRALSFKFKSETLFEIKKYFS